MLIGLISKQDRHQVEVTGLTLKEVHDALEAQRPEGYRLVSAPTRMKAGTPGITATGTFELQGVLDEITGPNLDAVRAAVPDGWRLVSVRRP